MKQTVSTVNWYQTVYRGGFFGLNHGRFLYENNQGYDFCAAGYAILSGADCLRREGAVGIRYTVQSQWTQHFIHQHHPFDQHRMGHRVCRRRVQ